jgi:hypothetical protein
MSLRSNPGKVYIPQKVNRPRIWVLEAVLWTWSQLADVGVAQVRERMHHGIHLVRRQLHHFDEGRLEGLHLPRFG